MNCPKTNLCWHQHIGSIRSLTSNLFLWSLSNPLSFWQSAAMQSISIPSQEAAFLRWRTLRGVYEWSDPWKCTLCRTQHHPASIYTLHRPLRGYQLHVQNVSTCNMYTKYITIRLYKPSVLWLFYDKLLWQDCTSTTSYANYSVILVVVHIGQNSELPILRSSLVRCNHGRHSSQII